MGFLGKIFNASNKEEEKEPTKLAWIPLTTLSQLEALKKQSISNTVFIFKHSTRCVVSRAVLKQFEQLFDDSHQQIKVYYLDLLNYRNISNEIATQFQVDHQSPQLIVIKNEVAVANASHYEITQISLEKYK